MVRTLHSKAEEPDMRIANTTPVAVKSPVRITDEHYDLWYARPVLLGKIVKVGNYWFTEDGMRFVSSRNALDYLAKIRDMVELEVALEVKYREKIATGEFARKGREPRQGAEKKSTLLSTAKTVLRKNPFQSNPRSVPDKSGHTGTIRTSGPEASGPSPEDIHALITRLGYVKAEAPSKAK